MPKRKSTARDNRAWAHRSRLLDPVEVARLDSEEEKEEDSDSQTPPPMPPPPNAYTFQLDHFSTNCYVDKVVMMANDACIVQGTFLNVHGTEVRVDVPTTSFFDLHVLEPTAPHTWESLNLDGFFVLPAWGPDLQRSWEVLSTLQDNWEFTVTDFHGNPRTCRMTRGLVRQALALPPFDIQFNERSHKDEHRYLCADELEPR